MIPGADEAGRLTGKCLVVIDGFAHGFREQLPSCAGGCHVLTLGVPPEWVRGEVHEGVAFVDVAPLAAAARDALRSFVPAFYAGLPGRPMADGRTLSETLFPGDAQAWWLTDLSEKSIFRGHLIERLYALALVREAIEQHRPDHVWLGLRDEPLAECLQQGLQGSATVRRLDAPSKARANHGLRARLLTLGTALEFILVRLLLVGMNSRRVRSARGRLVFFSFYPAWWRNAWEGKDKRTEVFFQGLPRRLAEHQEYTSEYAVWLVGSPFDWLRKLRRLRELAATADINVLQKSCPLSAVYRLFGRSVRGVVGRVRRLSEAALTGQFAGFPIGELLRDELLHTVSDRELYRNLLLRESTRGLVPGGGGAFIFRVEFQPFERALLQGIGGACKSFGFQHSSVGEDYLSHRFPSAEVHALDHDAAAARFPDYFLCTGWIPAQILLDNGFAPDRVVVCGAVRYPELRRLLALPQAPQQSTQEKSTILVPVSLDRQEALSLAAVLAEAVRGRESRLCIRVKGHPADDHSARVAGFLCQGNPLLSVEIMPAGGTLYEGIVASRALVMTGSTVGLEALALGVVPIVYQNGHMFSYTMSSLQAVRDAVVIVGNVAELATALDRVLAETVPFAELREKWLLAVDSMLGGLHGEAPEDLFIQAVEGALARHHALR